VNVRLGEITCPSGDLLVIDGGYLDQWDAERHRAAVHSGGVLDVNGVPAVAIAGLPSDRPLWVEASELEDGWGEFRVVVSDASVTDSVELGTIVVDWARIAFADAGALAEWVHHEPIDERADVAFWGRSEAEAAAAHDAPLLGIPGEEGVHGWRDLPIDEAEDRERALWAWVEADPGRKMMVDYRPHSHHFQVMAGVRASPHGAGTVELAGARILFANTSWGDGYFPVYADRDADGNLVAIRVVLADGSEPDDEND
jgi:hypothetical protein